ncbi:MAG TPA: FAD-binding oxidoreductase [Methylomirabilota bacterium]|nr:FAD-binding oxidoreductase [Methylomirabilota bacterium]
MMIPVITLSGCDREIPARAVQKFARQLSGRLLLPAEAGYDDARTVWNRMIDRRPAMIAQCARVEDVIAAIRFARERDLLVSVRGGGHNVTGYAVCERGLMIDLSPMKAVRVDPRHCLATVEAGLTWKEFDTKTQAHGLATTGGIISSTGVAGLTLGGGHGWLMRKHGLACDNVEAVEVVTADGRRLRASHDEHADLFWGVRGGGGNFGIVTSFEFRLHPVSTVLGGLLLFPLTRGREVLDVYRRQTLVAPDELTCGALITVWHDATPVIAVALCYCGPAARGEELVAPFRKLGSPILDTVRVLPYAELQTMFDATNPPGRWYYKTGYLDRERMEGDRFVDVLLEHCGFPSPSPLSRIFIEHLGGAMGRVAPEATAFFHRRAPFDLIVIAGGFRPEETAKNVEWARATAAAMRPFMSGGAYVNYLDADAGADAVRAAYGSAYERLIALKETYDPQNIFRLNQNIRPSRPG